MGSATMSDLPPLPKGFILDAAPSQTTPPLPLGFTLDAPQGNAISDIVPEIKNAASQNIDAIKGGLLNNPQTSALGGLMDTGRGLLGVGGLISSPITGAARSLIGHPLAAIEHAIGTQIAPEIAAKDNPQQMYEQAKNSVDTAMMALKPRGATPAGVLTKAAPAPSLTDLKASATAGYNAAKSSGVEFKPTALTNFASKVRSELNDDGLNDILAPKTFGTIDKISQAPEGATVTVNDFRTLQRAIGNAAKSIDPTERLAAVRSLQSLNDHIENLPAGDILRGTPTDVARVSELIKTANRNYSAYKQAENFNLRGEKAQNNAAAANSGMNLENNLRSQVRQILNNPKLQRGMNAETLQAMHDFNNGSRSANTLRAIGNILGGGGWSTLINGIIGHAVLGPLGAVAEPALGAAIKMAGNRRALKQFEKLSEGIRAASPLGQSLPPVQIPLPRPLTIGALPHQFPQLPILGMMPAYASQDQRNAR